MRQPPRLRPLSLGEILDVAIQLYRRFFRSLVLAAAVVTVPVSVLQALVRLSLPSSGSNLVPGSQPAGHAVQGAAAWAGVGAFFITAVLGFVASTLATATNLKAVSDGYLGGEPTWRDSLAFATRRLGSLVWLAVLTAVLLTFAFVALVVPGVYFYGAWLVAVPVLLLEGTSGRKALKRSRQLIRGRWWITAATFLVAMLLRTIISGVPGGVVVAISFASGTASTVVGLVVSGILSVVLTPFTAAVTAVIYYDLRVRKEGFDIELLARSFATPLEP